MLRATQYLAILALALSSWAPFCQSVPMEYCATLNTASMAANLSIYQSNGLCSGFCQERNAAFAIVQYQSCWCSDYAPGSSTTNPTSECSRACPGYGEETCGGLDGQFGYIALGRAPSGTVTEAPRSTSTPPPREGHVTKTETESVQDKVTWIQPPAAPSPSASSSTKTEDVSSTSPPGHDSDPTPTAVQTVTADGTVRTVFVTPTSGSQQNSSMSTASHGPSTGTVVGIVVGIIIFVVLASGAGVYFYLVRRKRRQHGHDDIPSQRGSSAGMSTTPKTDMAEAGQWGTGPGSSSHPELGRRQSQLMPMDPRMDPFNVGIYARNKSHESINTLRDDHDYSRKVHQPKVLRATNPDPALDE